MYTATYLQTTEQVIEQLTRGKTVYFSPPSKELWRQGKTDPEFYTGSISVRDTIKIHLQYGIDQDDVYRTLSLDQIQSVVERIVQNHDKVYVFLYSFDHKPS